MEEIILKPGDIFLTRGKGLISRGIRICTRGIGEPRTKVNHVGIMVTEGTVRTAMAVEALNGVVKHTLWDQYGPPAKDDVAIYRANNLSQDEIGTIVKATESYVGRKYGYVKIVAHFLDWLLLGSYMFRKIASMDKYPICSWVVAKAYAKAGKDFGVEPGAASPDDIWDFIEAHPEVYQVIHVLGAL